MQGFFSRLFLCLFCNVRMLVPNVLPTCRRGFAAKYSCWFTIALFFSKLRFFENKLKEMEYGGDLWRKIVTFAQ